MGELEKWRDQKWVRIGTDGKIKGACGTSKNKKNPDRCLPLAKEKKAGSRGTQFVSNTSAARVRNA